MPAFRWNDWNIDHVAEHGIEPPEAEYVVSHPARGYPRNRGSGKVLVRGQTEDGRYLQVIYVIDQDNETIYVIHARPLTPREKRSVTRNRR